MAWRDRRTLIGIVLFLMLELGVLYAVFGVRGGVVERAGVVLLVVGTALIGGGLVALRLRPVIRLAVSGGLLLLALISLFFGYSAVVDW